MGGRMVSAIVGRISTSVNDLLKHENRDRHASWRRSSQRQPPYGTALGVPAARAGTSCYGWLRMERWRRGNIDRSSCTQKLCLDRALPPVTPASAVGCDVDRHG